MWLWWSLTTLDLSLGHSLHADSFGLCIHSGSHALFSSMISIVVVFIFVPIEVQSRGKVHVLIFALLLVLITKILFYRD